MTPWLSYERYSSDLQNPRSVEQQYEDNLRAEGGTPAARRFSEPATSGTMDPDQRDVFPQLLAFLRASPFVYRVRIWDVDRLARLDARQHFFWEETLHRAGALEIAYTHTKATGNALTDFLTTGVAAHGAGDFSKKRSLATARGLRAQAREGLWTGAVPPYGYDVLYEATAGAPAELLKFVPEHVGARTRWRKDVYDPATRALRRSLPPGVKFRALGRPVRARLVPGAPDRVAIVREVFERYLLGDGMRQIAGRLNVRGVQAPFGGTWALRSVQTILGNAAYAGAKLWGRSSESKFYVRTSAAGDVRERTEAEVRAKLRRKDGGTRKRILERSPAGAIMRREGAHEALIDPEAFARAEELQRERGARFRGRTATSPYTLSGLVRCEGCGGSCFGRRQRCGKKLEDGSRAIVTKYLCSAHHTKGRAVCDPHAIPCARVERAVIRWLGRELGLHLDRDRLRARVRDEILAATAAPVEPPAIAESRRALATIEEELRGFRKLRPAVAAFYQDRIEAAIIERARLEARLRELAAAPAGPPARPVDVDGLADLAVGFLTDLGTTLAGGTPAERRRFLGCFVVNVTPHPSMNTVTVRYRPTAMAMMTVLTPGRSHQGQNGIVLSAEVRMPRMPGDRRCA